MDILLVTCPHCGITIEVAELNCCIFRCGIYKENFTQIDPHMKKEDCDHLVNKTAIYGCSKPFQLILLDNRLVAIPCDYI